jgi:hypothetical protein
LIIKVIRQGSFTFLQPTDIHVIREAGFRRLPNCSPEDSLQRTPKNNKYRICFESVQDWQGDLAIVKMNARDLFVSSALAQ